MAISSATKIPYVEELTNDGENLDRGKYEFCFAVRSCKQTGQSNTPFRTEAKHTCTHEVDCDNYNEANNDPR